MKYLILTLCVCWPLAATAGSVGSTTPVGKACKAYGETLWKARLSNQKGALTTADEAVIQAGYAVAAPICRNAMNGVPSTEIDLAVVKKVQKETCGVVPRCRERAAE